MGYLLERERISHPVWDSSVLVWSKNNTTGHQLWYNEVHGGARLGLLFWRKLGMAMGFGRMIEEVETKPTQLMDHDLELQRKSFGNLTNSTSLRACVGPSVGAGGSDMASAMPDDLAD
ncbi:hypothetical protein ACH5RR_017400 [Cinchona calisaya]|uniref:Uncharacterized protein n=1 Tax=Cinchona calisaya TaxID=153742 RepID=A0ABD2ZK77_9GENT